MRADAGARPVGALRPACVGGVGARGVCSARQVMRPVWRSGCVPGCSSRALPGLGSVALWCPAGGCPRWGQPGVVQQSVRRRRDAAFTDRCATAGWAACGGRSLGGAARAIGVVLVLARTSRGRARGAGRRLCGPAGCPVRGARWAEGRCERWWLPVRPLSSGRLVSPCRCPPSPVVSRRPGAARGGLLLLNGLLKSERHTAGLRTAAVARAMARWTGACPGRVRRLRANLRERALLAVRGLKAELVSDYLQGETSILDKPERREKTNSGKRPDLPNLSFSAALFSWKNQKINLCWWGK